MASALANPAARIVAIDACLDPLTFEGKELTNRIAGEEGLNIVVEMGWSPDDVPRVVAAHATSPFDLCLIDAWHDDPHQTADFNAIRPFASPDCI